MTMLWESWMLTLWPPGLEVEIGWADSRGKIFATMLLHSWFPLIWKYATWPCSEKNEFWHDSRVGGSAWFDMQHDHVQKNLNLALWTLPSGSGCWGMSVGKIFATVLLHSWFHLIWYATWACSVKNNFWVFDPTQRVVYRQNIFYHVAAFLFPFHLICNMTVFWKS